MIYLLILLECTSEIKFFCMKSNCCVFQKVFIGLICNISSSLFLDAQGVAMLRGIFIIFLASEKLSNINSSEVIP